MPEQTDPDAIAAIRASARDFLDRLRAIDPNILIDLVVKSDPAGSASGFSLEVREALEPLPKPDPPPKPDPFKDVPFGDTPWHDHARPQRPETRA